MDDSLLNRLSTRAEVDPAFLAYVLANYGQMGGPVTDDLRQHLGLSLRDFQRLGLYLRPRAEHFEADVRKTSEDFNIDPLHLAALIRFVDAADAMSDTEPGPMRLPLPEGGVSGYLIAARERRTPASGPGDTRRDKGEDT